jgi:GH24 family phage-related lysozyme (muramidase)
MKQAVRDIWTKYTTILEGCVPHFYLDIKGLVTIGLGCLVDPVGMATGLPFVLKSDRVTLATKAEIAADWTRIKSRQYLSKYHYNRAGMLCTLTLLPEGIERLKDQRISAYEPYFLKKLPNFATWPADAQAATLSMAWAMGAGFIDKFPSWKHAAMAYDWLGCAQNCQMRTTGNAGLIPRNKANQALFLAAQTSDPDLVSLSVIRTSHPVLAGL